MLENLLNKPNSLENLKQAFFNKLNDLQILYSTETGPFLQEYHQLYSTNKSIQERFGNFDQFCDEILFWSYGLALKTDKGNNLKFEKKGEPKQFRKRVNLFLLIKHLIEKYPKKYESYKDFRLTKKIRTNSKKMTLTVSFNQDFWDNIFNDYHLYQGTDDEPVCLFDGGKHTLASYLHSAHPNVHYLNIKGTFDLEDKVNDPLCTAILINAQGGKQGSAAEQYLIVEGVVGNFGNIKERDKIYKLMWTSIKKYAFSRGKNIFINTCHSPNQIEPHEFIDFVLKYEKKIRKSGVKGGIIKKDIKGSEQKVFRLERDDTKIIKLKDGEWFTHHFISPIPCDYEHFSLKSREKFFYEGDQYNDTFHLWHSGNFPDKKDLNSYWKLEKYCQGFEMKCPKPLVNPFTLMAIPTLLATLSLAIVPVHSYFNIQKLNQITYQGQVLEETSSMGTLDKLKLILEKKGLGTVEEEEISFYTYEPCKNKKVAMTNPKGEGLSYPVCEGGMEWKRLDKNYAKDNNVKYSHFEKGNHILTFSYWDTKYKIQKEISYLFPQDADYPQIADLLTTYFTNKKQ